MRRNKKGKGKGGIEKGLGGKDWKGKGKEKEGGRGEEYRRRMAWGNRGS